MNYSDRMEVSPEDIFNQYFQKYVGNMRPLFMPNDPASNDIVNYFSSLLRVLGLEDRGWDPHVESEALVNDFHNLFSVDLPADKFPEPESTHWRLGLLIYSHVVEMSAPYEILLNLIRFKLNEGYSPNPYFKYLNTKEQKDFERYGIKTYRKIQIIKELALRARLSIGEIFDDYYNADLRNAFNHSNYILTDEGFRARLDLSGMKTFTISYKALDKKLTCAKAFVAAFLYMHHQTRLAWGERAGEGIPYDPHYKGLMEVLVDEEKLMCGFKVHWPNYSESYYQRKKDGIDMVNCCVSIPNATLELMVGLYARKPGKFSPLVEEGQEPRYTPLEISGDPARWPDDFV
ncbi:MAG: hypothetical protein H6922_04165 [Pseudomonadaceae bacterium]|nr:hypothetical protein [Pseudomonadaceae bacterium]